MSDYFIPFNINSPLNKDIYQKMYIWEKLVMRFFLIFRKDLLPDYFSTLGLKQLEHEVSQDEVHWYDLEHKELTSQFAEDLHHFLRALAVIVPILKETTGSPAMREKNHSPRVPLMERVFCALQGDADKNKYPFVEREIFKLVNNVPIRTVEKLISEKISNYVAQFDIEYIGALDDLYTRLVYIDKALSISTMDFLRRFNIDVNLTDNFIWDPLTLTATTYYFESFYESLLNLNLDEDDFLILNELEKVRQEFNPETNPITEEDMREAWEKVTNYMSLCYENERLLKLIRLAHRNLEYEPHSSTQQFTFFDKFCSELEVRLTAVGVSITKNSIKHEMQQLVQDILPSSLYSTDLTDVGVFTSANSERIQSCIGESFRNVYAMSLLQVFIVKFYKPWVKIFLGNCAVNAQFHQTNGRSQLNQLYKGFNRLTESFDKFSADVQPKSSMGMRITRLLENSKMNRSDKHLLKVFTDSLNSQADTFVKEFYKNFPQLYSFIVRVHSDLESNSAEFIANIMSVKSLQDPALLDRLNDLKTFSASVIDLLNISFPNDKTSNH